MAEPLGAPIEPDSEPTPIAERFGRYELIAELASGGMASVYLARLASEGDVTRVVAIKRIHPHLAKSTAFADMFLDEARIAARIDHPNVCQVLEHGRENGISFLAMEFLAGEPLQRVVGALARQPDASVRRAMLVATLVAEAADGLHAAHELVDARGAPLDVVHRDVSPHNVFVTFDGAVKVVDFGIASARNQIHHTEAGAIKGKFAYMAPELLAGAKADRRADVWALGVVLWEVLALKRLFRRDGPSEALRAVERDPIVPPSVARPGLPTALDAIALRALCRDPTGRYATAKELARDLRSVVRASGQPVDREAIAEWMATLFPDGEARRRAWIADAGAKSISGSRAAPVRPATDEPVTAVTRPEPRRPASRTRLLAALGAMVLVVAGASGLALHEPAPTTVVGAPPPSTLTTVAPAVVPTTTIDEPLASIARVEVAALPTTTRRSATRPAPASAAPPPTPIDDRPGCITLGGGIVATIDETNYEGPRARCIEVHAGTHAIAVADAASGDAVYARSLDVAPGAHLALTSGGVR